MKTAMSLHGACPTSLGIKWVSNKWIREGEQVSADWQGSVTSLSNDNLPGVAEKVPSCAVEDWIIIFTPKQPEELMDMELIRASLEPN